MTLGRVAGELCKDRIQPRFSLCIICQPGKACANLKFLLEQCFYLGSEQVRKGYLI